MISLLIFIQFEDTDINTEFYKYFFFYGKLGHVSFVIA